MKKFPLQGRTLALLAVVVPLLALFVYVVLRSGPLAPVAVTLAQVERKALTPALFGVGTIGARTTTKIGPTVAGRIQRLDVDVGDSVQAGQVLGEMDAVDLQDRLQAQEAALRRVQASLREAQARQAHAQAQATRYAQLLAVRSTSEELAAAKQQELQVADAAVAAAQAEAVRVRAERAAIGTQWRHLRLVAPAAGLVTLRFADPGTTVVAGQAVVEVVDPASLWINVRLDQINAHGLKAGLPAHVVLRSRAGQALAGRVLRVEPLADAVTEETLAKVVFEALPSPLPPLGELAEVTIALPALAAQPVLPNAAVQRVGGQTGVWRWVDGQLQFAPVQLGSADLDGHVQVLQGLDEGDQVVVYSEKPLTERSRIRVVEHLAPGAAQGAAKGAP
ncbi:efflux RND transporter periplasmic adaptor subunit [Acidovorax soli]|uniref:efflux RND transporter periplasmic adaptor subunit n=1 Tax=Acidovorax TaxID=12916 RepID=UPI0026ECD0DA|nr:efflux RND transporter periplasmic adaptor subunit [Acidovorax soli]MCM2347895.1 efflux RND transporter periplasmic adaptor subunit [Acidovorax soli]